MPYDVIVVGGGIGGAALATVLAKNGKSVLVLERETKFKDRVRGENMLPWGVAVARRLGVLDGLLAAGGRQAPYWAVHTPGGVDKRDLPATTPHGQPCVNMYHPDMQEVLLQGAVDAGADVRRGVNVEGIDVGSGQSPTATFAIEGGTRTETARLVVGADGRNSKMRSWGGFDVNRDPEFLTIAGALQEGVGAPEDSTHLVFGPGLASLVAPLGQGRARTYAVYPTAQRRQLSGKEGIAPFLDVMRGSGVPADWLEGARVTGPLAEFVGADTWVNSPARRGLALLGDAAASTDPCWGCGLSKTMLDVETLADCLTSSNDWEQAALRYAQRHDEHYAALHRILGWMNELFWTPGPEADARRQRVFARMGADPREFPDSLGMGPLGPSDERARRLILGEES